MEKIDSYQHFEQEIHALVPVVCFFPLKHMYAVLPPKFLFQINDHVTSICLNVALGPVRTIDGGSFCFEFHFRSTSNCSKFCF